MTAAYAIALLVSSLSTNPASTSTVPSMVAADELGAQMHTVQHASVTLAHVRPAPTASTGWWSETTTTVAAVN